MGQVKTKYDSPRGVVAVIKDGGKLVGIEVAGIKKDEEDPVFSASPSATITEQDKTNWNNASTMAVAMAIALG